jgi:acylphosphatase
MHFIHADSPCPSRLEQGIRANRGDNRYSHAHEPHAATAPWRVAGTVTQIPMKMGQKRVHMIISGRVQGVYFRASAQREARLLGVTGYVRNRPDGSVEIVAEGEEDLIKSLLLWSQKGPSTARVDKVETRWRSYAGEFSDFRILP